MNCKLSVSTYPYQPIRPAVVRLRVAMTSPTHSLSHVQEQNTVTRPRFPRALPFHPHGRRIVVGPLEMAARERKKKKTKNKQNKSVNEKAKGSRRCAINLLVSPNIFRHESISWEIETKTDNSSSSIGVGDAKPKQCNTRMAINELTTVVSLA